MAFEELFAAALDEYGQRYEVQRENYTDLGDFYKQEFGSHWRSAMASDLSDVLGTKPASIARQLARYDQGTRGVGPKYAAAMAEIGSELPPMRLLPNKNFRVTTTMYFIISKTPVTRHPSVTFSNLSGSLQDLLDSYAAGGTMSGEDWMEALDGIGEISIEEI